MNKRIVWAFCIIIPQNSFILFTEEACTGVAGGRFENESDVRRGETWFAKLLVNLGLSVYNYNWIEEGLLAISSEKIIRF
ncbi:MAG: hypothetical protein Q4A63_02275 [Butyricicoccus pullicaecorum]|nr:hypothetical protein [Butyricicoccus pullicaecorum]MDO4668623.1 hypothetical protein [Butyricicoccus pullicaecorum]